MSLNTHKLHDLVRRVNNGIRRTLTGTISTTPEKTRRHTRLLPAVARARVLVATQSVRGPFTFSQEI